MKKVKSSISTPSKQINWWEEYENLSYKLKLFCLLEQADHFTSLSDNFLATTWVTANQNRIMFVHKWPVFG